MARTRVKTIPIRKKPIGQPTNGRGWKIEYIELVKNYAILGATEEEIAEFFDVTHKTITIWKQKYPEFKAALNEGREIADARVAKALYTRALGYSCPDTDIKVIDGEIVKTNVTKHYPPDTTAGIFWLKNRRPNEWRDKKVVEGEGGVIVQVVKFGEDDGNSEE